MLETQPPSLTFRVLGIPQPKGSMKPIVRWSRGKARAVVIADNPMTKAWQDTVAWFALNARHAMFEGPVAVSLVFRLRCPLRRRLGHHLTKPDVDKLARCVLDALTGILYPDDCHVVELHARKLYALRGEEQLEVTVTRRD